MAFVFWSPDDYSKFIQFIAQSQYIPVKTIAGCANQEAGRLNMAFVFLNRYLDLSEAMEDDADAGPLENADFVDTDIPFDFSIPDIHYIAEDLREEAACL